MPQINPIAKRKLSQAMIDELNRRSEMIRYFNTQVKKPFKSMGISGGPKSSRGGYRIEPEEKDRIKKRLGKSGLAKSFKKLLEDNLSS